MRSGTHTRTHTRTQHTSTTRSTHSPSNEKGALALHWPVLACPGPIGTGRFLSVCGLWRAGMAAWDEMEECLGGRSGSGSGIAIGNGAGEAKPSEATVGRGGAFSFFSFWGKEGGGGCWDGGLDRGAGEHLDLGRARLCSSAALRASIDRYLPTWVGRQLGTLTTAQCQDASLIDRPECATQQPIPTTLACTHFEQTTWSTCMQLRNKPPKQLQAGGAWAWACLARLAFGRARRKSRQALLISIPCFDSAASLPQCLAASVRCRGQIASCHASCPSAPTRNLCLPLTLGRWRTTAAATSARQVTRQ